MRNGFLHIICTRHDRIALVLAPAQYRGKLLMQRAFDVLALFHNPSLPILRVPDRKLAQDVFGILMVIIVQRELGILFVGSCALPIRAVLFIASLLKHDNICRNVCAAKCLAWQTHCAKKLGFLGNGCAHITTCRVVQKRIAHDLHNDSILFGRINGLEDKIFQMFAIGRVADD